MSEYVVVSVFDPADGKARIVHTWGPAHPDRAKATAAKRRMQREGARRKEGRAGTLTYHVCEILGDGPSR